MKRFMRVLLSMVILFAAVFPMNAYADTGGSGNVDGGGGGMGDGTSTNSWTPGNEGVRVTVVRASDRAVVTIPFDFTNKAPSSSIYNFGKVSKLQYNSGRSLSPVKGGYVAIKPAQTMPKIISTNGSNNIEAIKRYFCSEYVVKRIAEITGMKYDVLIGGEYKILLEPIAYYKFEGVKIATTATEAAAMYDEQVGSLLRRKMGSFSHKNLPLAMFLEVADLGYPAWSGSRSKAASNSDIKSALGLGIVRFNDAPAEPPEVSVYDYEYRVNTEVITAITVSGGQSDPDHPISATFYVNGRSHRVSNIYYPDGDSQLAWISWTTPSIPQRMTIMVTVSGGGSSSKATINVNIVDLDKNPPPNPVADDRNDSFRKSAVHNNPQQTSANWTVWRPWWQEHWAWHCKWVWVGSSKNGHWVDRGKWVDEGEWKFNLERYQASLSASMAIQPDDKSPTASGKTMKSGYGINQTVSARVRTKQSSAVTGAQTAVTYFPEFGYQTYWRLLERMNSGYSSRFEFQKNSYSTYNGRTHFSPVWFPDGSYTQYTWLADSWTPAGMLSMNLTDSVTIRDNLWTDWHIAPQKPN